VQSPPRGPLEFSTPLASAWIRPGASNAVGTEQPEAGTEPEAASEVSAAVPPLHIRTLTFNDGTQLELVPGHVVVLVGPNNVGKSNALQALAAELRQESRSGHRVITGVNLAEADGHPEPLVDWVKGRFHRFRPGPGDPWVYGTASATVNESQLNEVPLHRNTLIQIRRVVTFVANAQERLNLTRPASPIDRRRTAPQTPIQALFGDTEKVERLSDASLGAFGQPLTFSHHDGFWRLRLGAPRVEATITGRHLFPTAETQSAIDALPVVEEQGDGLRSYLGVLLELLADRHLFIMLDEPEAFLHPPQARQLATEIMRTKPIHSQLFVATHDSNFVRGLLDATDADLSIVRIERREDRNPVRVINPGTVVAVSSDPVLRHSSVLDSLFHSGAVVCEAEPDCLLYESALKDNSLIGGGKTIHFLGSSGKQRVRKTCELLTSLGVPTAAIVDFDILKNEDEVFGLLDALQTHDDQIDDLVRRVVTQLREQAASTAKTKATLLEEVAGVLDGLDDDDELSTNKLREVDGVLRSGSTWGTFKTYGVDGTRGDLNRDVQALLNGLSARRLHVVPVGELEGWFRDANGRGGSYVAYVLENSLHTSPDSGTLQQFSRTAVESLLEPNSAPDSAAR